MRIWLLVFGLVVFGCGEDDKKYEPVPTPVPTPVPVPPGTLTYAVDVSPLIQRSCLPCHGGETPQKGTGFDTRERMIKNAKKAVNKIRAGAMPPANSGKPSIDQAGLTTIINWYNSGAN